MSDGNKVYLAIRSRLEIYRSGELSVNAAEAKGVACWAVDESTLLDLKATGVNLIGVYEWESGDKYLATTKDWDSAKFLDYTSRGGALQRFLPVKDFLVALGRTKL